MRHAYGAEVVGRRARLLRSDGRWHGVVATGFDRSTRLHDLRFIAEDASGSGATAAYDLNHPARHVRWVADDGTSLLPTDAHPCPRRIDEDGGGGGAGASPTTPSAPGAAAPAAATTTPPAAARRRPGGAGPASLSPMVTATHLSIGAEKFALSSVARRGDGAAEKSPGDDTPAVPPSGVAADADVVLLSSVGGSTRFLFTAALVPSPAALVPSPAAVATASAAGGGPEAGGDGKRAPLSLPATSESPPAPDTTTTPTTTTGSLQRRVLSVVNGCLTEEAAAESGGDGAGAASANGATSLYAPPPPPQPPPAPPQQQVSLRLLPVVLPPSGRGRVPALPLPPPPGGWATAAASPEARLDPHRLLYRRLAVHWPREGAWFAGRVTRYDASSDVHTVAYDDGDVRVYHLPSRSYAVLPEPGAAEGGYNGSSGASAVGRRLLVEVTLPASPPLPAAGPAVAVTAAVPPRRFPSASPRAHHYRTLASASVVGYLPALDLHVLRYDDPLVTPAYVVAAGAAGLPKGNGGSPSPPGGSSTGGGGGFDFATDRLLRSVLYGTATTGAVAAALGSAGYLSPPVAEAITASTSATAITVAPAADAKPPATPAPSAAAAAYPGRAHEEATFLPARPGLAWPVDVAALPRGTRVLGRRVSVFVPYAPAPAVAEGGSGDAAAATPPPRYLGGFLQPGTVTEYLPRSYLPQLRATTAKAIDDDAVAATTDCGPSSAGDAGGGAHGYSITPWRADAVRAGGDGGGGTSLQVVSPTAPACGDTDATPPLPAHATRAASHVSALSLAAAVAAVDDLAATLAVGAAAGRDHTRHRPGSAHHRRQRHPLRPDPGAHVKVVFDDGTAVETALGRLVFTWLEDAVPCAALPPQALTHHAQLQPAEAERFGAASPLRDACAAATAGLEAALAPYNSCSANTLGGGPLPSSSSAASQLAAYAAATRLPLLRPAPGRVGLLNMGNTCWLGATLQAVAATTPLAAALLHSAFPRAIRVGNPGGLQGRMAVAVAELAAALWGGQAGLHAAVGDGGMDGSAPQSSHQSLPRMTHQAVAPAFVKALLCERHPSTFTGMGQQDAHEGLVTLLDALHEDLAVPAVAPPQQQPVAPAARAADAVNTAPPTATGAILADDATVADLPPTAPLMAIRRAGGSGAASSAASSDGTAGGSGSGGGAPAVPAAPRAASALLAALGCLLSPRGSSTATATTSARASASAAPQPTQPQPLHATPPPPLTTTSLVQRLFFVTTATELTCTAAGFGADSRGSSGNVPALRHRHAQQHHPPAAYHRRIVPGPPGGEMLPPLPLRPGKREVPRSLLPPRRRGYRDSTLTDCLGDYFRPEEAAAGTRCEDCARSGGGGSGRPRVVTSRPWLTSLPPVLVVHLKRFEFSAGDGQPVKITEPVTFPLRGLDMAPYLLLPQHEHAAPASLGQQRLPQPANVAAGGGDSAAAPNPPTSSASSMLYDLYAVVMHAGGAGGGHYTAFCRRVRAGAAARAAVALLPDAGTGDSGQSASGSSSGRDSGSSVVDSDSDSDSDSALGAAAGGDSPAPAAADVGGNGSEWAFYDDGAVTAAAEADVAHPHVATLAYLLFYARREEGGEADGLPAVSLQPPWRASPPQSAAGRAAAPEAADGTTDAAAAGSASG